MSFRKQRCSPLCRPLWPHALAVAFTLVATAPSRTDAQNVRSDRPYRGLFGGGGGGADRGQTLDLNWSTLGAYDDNVIADTGAGIDPSTQVGGTFSTAGASLGYSARGERVSLGATFASGGRYYPDLQQLSAFDASAGVNVAATLGRSITLQAAQAFRYQPYYQFGFLTGQVPSDPAVTRTNDEAITALTSYDYDGSVSAEARLGARSSFVVDYGHRQTRFAESDEGFVWQRANARFNRGVTRYASLRLGYGYSEAQNTLGSAGPRIASQIFDIGVDYNRSLSFSRRTTLAFGSGSTLMRQDNVEHFVINADVNVVREIGRTWRANGGYHRGVQFVAGFNDPLLADSVQVGLGGLLNRRSQVNASVGYSSGQVGLGSTDQGYSTYTGSAALRLALSRWFSVDTQYVYYHYGFDDTVALPFGLVRNLNRHGIRFGLSGWLPLVR